MTTIGELDRMSKYNKGEFYISNGRVHKMQNKPVLYKHFLQNAFERME